jgi:hypothetical protein
VSVNAYFTHMHVGQLSCQLIAWHVLSRFVLRYHMRSRHFFVTMFDIERLLK